MEESLPRLPLPTGTGLEKNLHGPSESTCWCALSHMAQMWVSGGFWQPVACWWSESSEPEAVWRSFCLKLFLNHVAEEQVLHFGDTAHAGWHGP